MRGFFAALRMTNKSKATADPHGMTNKRQVTAKLCRRQVGGDHGFDLVPDSGVAFDLDVALGECAGEPGVAGGGDGVVLVGEVDVVEDLRGGGVGGGDEGAAVE